MRGEFETETMADQGKGDGSRQTSLSEEDFQRLQVRFRMTCDIEISKKKPALISEFFDRAQKPQLPAGGDMSQAEEW